MSLGLYVILITSFLPWIKGHGRLIEPPSRATAWRYGFNTPHNYNDHELYCGGFTRQWVKNEGKCGVCGDAWDAKLPRPHEYGGTYGQGYIVRKYGVGSTIKIRVELTANHFGYFTFAICPDYKKATQECLDKHILKLANPQEGVDHENVRYFPKDGNKIYEMKYKLPENTCEHCLLQWRYVAGNNWGNCPNGTGAVGCGPQEEFRACADITVSGEGGEEELVPEVTTTTTVLPPGTTPTAEESYSPITALVISLVSFLVVFLVLSLLYFHFYQVGKQVKLWIKGDKTRVNNINIANMTAGDHNKNSAPLPPPRNKRIRTTSMNKDGLDEIDLREESLA